MFIGIEASHANKEQRTGVEEYCWQIIRELKHVIPSDARVVLYCNEPLRGELGVLPSQWSVKILRWPFKKLWSQIRLALEFLFSPPDIFFAPGQLVPFICPKNTIVMVHDSAFMAFPQAYRFWGRQYLKWMNRLIVRKAKVILTATEFNKNELLKYCGREIEQKIAVVPLGYDDQRYTIRDNKNLTEIKKILNKYYLRDHYIISIGRLETKKNTKNIVKAFNLLKGRYKLILIGTPGVGYDEVKQEIQKSPYKNDIITLGWVEKDELPCLLQSALVFVFPSLYEGFGLPVLEAMACGCPVVGANIPALREVAGSAAIYAEPSNPAQIADATERLMSDEKYRDDKIKAGLERVKNFSWARTAARTWEVINSSGV